jgi:hypothetical protein
MRFSSLALAACLITVPQLARAQAVTFSNVVRTGSPRAAEQASGVLSRDQPLGARDCPCEQWTFEGTINPSATARTLEWWIGTNATACATSTNRYPANNATCWPLSTLGLNATLPIAGNRFSVTIPARWIVDPLNGACQLPSAVSSGSSLHVAALLRPPDDSVPLGTVPITVITQRPQAVQTVSASGAESSAIVTWEHLSTGDGGTAQVPENTAGYWVLCLPRIVGYDAGLTGSTCGRSSLDSGSSADATAIDATSDDATSDDGSSSTMDSGSSSGSCGSESLPSTFDPNDDSQLAQYACSPFLSVGTSRYTVSGLTNGSSYRFAVVAQDTSGNRSTPSSFTGCVSPEQVTDFWEHYRNSPGNPAAPGACSVRPNSTRSRGALFAAIALALGAARTLHRARRKEPRA